MQLLLVPGIRLPLIVDTQRIDRGPSCVVRHVLTGAVAGVGLPAEAGSEWMEFAQVLLSRRLVTPVPA
jgi:hypothetical protein